MAPDPQDVIKPGESLDVRRGNTRILLVDSSRIFLRNFQLLLRAYGYEVMGVVTPSEALETIGGWVPDVITVDRTLLNGMYNDLIERLKQAAPAAKIILISAQSDFEAVMSGLSIGASECVTRPINLQRLLTTVNCLLDQAA